MPSPSSFFSAPAQRTFDTAHMDGEPKVLGDPLRDLRRAELGLALQDFQDKGQHLLGEFGSSPGSLGLRQQPGQPLGLEAFAKLV